MDIYDGDVFSPVDIFGTSDDDVFSIPDMFQPGDVFGIADLYSYSNVFSVADVFSS